MPIDLRQAFAAAGLKAEFRGHPATVLPVTAEVLAIHDRPDHADRIGQPVMPGQMVVAWNDGTARHGMVLNGSAGNDLRILLPLSDGTDAPVPASNLAQAGIEMLRLARLDLEERDRIAKEHAAALADHEAAVARGTPSETPVARTPRFAEGAFAGAEAVRDCAAAAAANVIADPFADIHARSAAIMESFRLARSAEASLTPDEQSRLAEAKSLREEIARLTVDGAARAPYAGDGKATEEALDRLPVAGQAFSSVQRAALIGNRVMSEQVFGALTTTPPSDIAARTLSHSAFEAVTQELARHADTAWAPPRLAEIREALEDSMPGYRFEARPYTRGGCDMLVIRDHVGAYLYAWDSASRVTAAPTLAIAAQGPDAVPSVEDLHALRVQVSTLRFDNGAEIDFGFADPAPEDDGPQP